MYIYRIKKISRTHCASNGVLAGGYSSYTIFVNRYTQGTTRSRLRSPFVRIIILLNEVQRINALSASVDLAGRLPCRAALQCLFCTGRCSRALTNISRAAAVTRQKYVGRPTD